MAMPGLSSYSMPLSTSSALKPCSVATKCVHRQKLDDSYLVQQTCRNVVTEKWRYESGIKSLHLALLGPLPGAAKRLGRFHCTGMTK